MKITETQLRRIIRQEFRSLHEGARALREGAAADVAAEVLDKYESMQGRPDALRAAGRLFTARRVEQPGYNSGNDIKEDILSELEALDPGFAASLRDELRKMAMGYYMSSEDVYPPGRYAGD
jgi:hypothetical protein